MSIAPSQAGSQAPSLSFSRSYSYNQGQNHINRFAQTSDMIIWGTDVSVKTCKEEFIKFLKESKFTIDEADMDEIDASVQRDTASVQSLYLNKLEEIRNVPNDPYLTVNCAHLKEFNPKLYTQLVYYPQEVIPIFELAINELFMDLYPDHSDRILISVRPFNSDQTTAIRGLNAEDVSKLVTLNGMVTRCSPLVPEMVQAFFRCIICSSTKEIAVEGGRIFEPHVCTMCNSKVCFALIHNRCKYIDRQLIKLQENPDDMPAGQTPSLISLVACADLVDQVSPGDRVFVTGVYKANPVRVLPRQRKLKTAYRTIIEVVHFRRIANSRLHDDSSTLRFTPTRIDYLRSLATHKDIYNDLSESICPSIFGLADVKKGVLLQLFGGTKKELPGKPSDPKLRHFRADVNVLLCGDPGTAKSQMLQYVYKLVPRGQYTSGKGSSAVGLTAYITRDIDTRQLVLQTGALVMCDGGICCIDEFDKMPDSTRGILHEVMEQQTLSIAKAGIVCQLNARTSVLAAANPVGSEWDIEKSVVDNIRLPDTLLSRFDLIFLILDPESEEYNRILAQHLISLYYQTALEEKEAYLGHDVLKDYIAYARSSVSPKLTEESVELLQKKYLNLRSDARTKGKINVYPRNLESLVRLSEAHAKMRLSHLVEQQDVEEAVRLYQAALKYSSTDTRTGKLTTKE